MACPPLLTEDDLLRFRTKACLRLAQGSCSFGLDRCQYCHSSVWTRRPPFFSVVAHQQRNSSDDRHQCTGALLRYLPVACSNLVVSNGNITAVLCHRGQNCPFAHSRDEIVYHPLLYKTEECDDHETSRCAVYYCWKAHGTKERRKPPKLRLGVVKGVDVQVFYPGITVVQLNTSGQKCVSGKGRSSETSKCGGGGQSKAAVRRGSKGGLSKKDCQHVASSVFPSKNIENMQVHFPCSDEAVFSFAQGGPTTYQRSQLPTKSAMSAAFAGVSWEDIRELCDGQRQTGYHTAETPVSFAGLQNLASVIRSSASDSGMDALLYSQKVAEMLQRSTEAVIGINSTKPFGVGSRGPGEESDDCSVAIDNAAALIAVMRLQANWLLGKKGGTPGEEFRAEEKHPRNTAELAAEEVAAGADVLGCLRSGAVTHTSPHCRADGDLQTLTNCRRPPAVDQSYTITRANSDGELLVPPLCCRNSRQGSEDSLSRTLSVSKYDNGGDCASFLVAPQIASDSAVGDEMCIMDLARSESTWVRGACESGIQGVSEVTFDVASTPDSRPLSVQLLKRNSQLVKPRAYDTRRSSVANSETETRIGDMISPPARQHWANKVNGSLAVTVRDTRGHDLQATTTGMSLQLSQIDGGRYTGDDGETYGDKRKATDSTIGGSSRSASGEKLATGDEIWGRPDVVDVGVHISGIRSASTVVGQQETSHRGLITQRQVGNNTATKQAKQDVNALELMKDGNADELKNDFLMAVTKELLKLVLGGEAQNVVSSEAPNQKWCSNGILTETQTHALRSERPGEQPSLTPGLLKVSNGVADDKLSWSPTIKKRVDTHPAISSESDNPLWW
ncbi:putative zinc finger protein [Toxoplasma gondii TgCatPRC2]|uniref:Putative zinc finger protein n=1 Tax=Toxoplasma gondii TgCatPRC2 TaxID=1130821 RepID=A0A151HMM1_TOXGO|nr:putative zinc finger protein [Toxoplasma gondii TgCatPRC2]